MELVLAALLAVAATAAVFAHAARKIERARAHQIEDELESLRKASSGARLLDAEAAEMAEAAPGEAPEAADAAARERVGDEVEAARRLVARAAEELRSRRGVSADAFAAGLDDRRRELRALLTRVERGEASLSAAVASGIALADRQAAAAEAAGASSAQASRPPAPAGPETLTSAGEAADSVTDEGFRLKESLGGVARSAVRLSDAGHAVSAAVTRVERSAEALMPFSPALSALANRINLLALNLAVLPSPGGGASMEEAGGELRALVDEARRLARELASASQRAADAARSARDSALDAAAMAADGQSHAERSGRELARLQETATELRGALEAARETLRVSEEGHRGCAARLEAESAREAVRATGSAARGDELARWLGEVRAAGSVLSELRLAAEQALGSLAESAFPADTHPPPELDNALDHLAAAAQAAARGVS